VGTASSVINEIDKSKQRIMALLINIRSRHSHAHNQTPTANRAAWVAEKARESDSSSPVCHSSVMCPGSATHDRKCHDLILHTLCSGFRKSGFRVQGIGFREGASIVII
jgi:hypothetical protein